MPSIEDLLVERAAEMAAHDGSPVHVAHIFGAANQLQAELLAARDRLIGHAGSAAPAPAIPAEPEPAPDADPAPQPANTDTPPASQGGTA